EQDGAAALGIEQRRTADHGQRRLGLAVDHLQLDAGLGGDTLAEMVGISGGAAGLGRDQPQPARLAEPDLVTADRQRRNRPFYRRLADGAGGGDALAEPDDAGEGIDHAEPVARGTGDQQPAIVGAEVQRSVDGGLSRCRSQPGRASARPMAVAKPREVVHQNVFPRPAGPSWNYRSLKP